MYDYNYEYGRSYYKPQVNYIGETIDSQTRRSRRRTMSPPRARTFSERWAANPFYGRYEPISEFTPRIYGVNPLLRASSIPADFYSDVDYAPAPADYRGRSVSRFSRARSATREASTFRGESVARTVRARSTARARSMSRAQSVYEGDYDDNRSATRGRSVSNYDDCGYYFDPLSDAEWNRVLKSCSKEEREKSIFQMRMSLENPRDLPRKQMMQTTVGPGMYQSSLYGTVTWASGRQ
jgi:hypothetical protein